MIAAGVAALRRWGAGATGSRLVTGSTQLHAELEDALAAHSAPKPGSFSPPVTSPIWVRHRPRRPNCLIVSDERNHASLVDACRLSSSRGREVAVVPHADPEAVARRSLPVRPEAAPSW